MNAEMGEKKVKKKINHFNTLLRFLSLVFVLSSSTVVVPHCFIERQRETESETQTQREER